MQTKISNNEAVQAMLSKLLSGDSHLSFSSLSAFAKSPIDFVRYKLGQKETTDAMLFGTLVHCLVLEPEKYEERYFVLDDVDICNQIGGTKPRATNKYKEWLSVAMSEAEGKELISEQDYKAAKRISMNIKNNLASGRLIKQATEFEKEVKWDFMNFKFKGFIDADGEKARIDLKICADASPKKFNRTIIDSRYYLQATMYNFSDKSTKPYYIIAADRQDGVSVHKMPDRLFDIGMKEYTYLLEKFNECILSDGFERSHDFWSERFDGTYIIDIPSYLY